MFIKHTSIPRPILRTPGGTKGLAPFPKEWRCVCLKRPAGPRPAASLPDAPNLDWLRKQAKRRLAELRQTNPDAKLADAQFDLAKQYGFCQLARAQGTYRCADGGWPAVRRCAQRATSIDSSLCSTRTRTSCSVGEKPYGGRCCTPRRTTGSSPP